MHALDHRLHEWLLEPDERRFELAFNAYFSVAFPAVIRYLARISHWEPARLEDLAQEALLRFFDRVGRDRRDAARSVVSALQRLRAPEPGSFHARQVQAWIDEVTRFREATLGFRVRDDATVKVLIQGLADGIPQLQRQGELLLRGVEQSTFCDDVRLVVDSLPQLRVPTNSYLFQIARNLYLDECKKHGRQKRGGAGSPAGHIQSHPVESPDDGDVEGPGDDTLAMRAFAPEFTAIREPAVDPAHEYESEEYFDKFLACLRAPLDDAAEAYRLAAANGSAGAEKRRLESLTVKFTRTMAVISAIGEGHTQEQVAELLGLTRNQVKYIIELVQIDYARFVMATHQTPTAVPNAREQFHAP
jgi:DNA-directed RNA polymerase specialized sigma24 family protein